jgi:hypothetical protein
MLKDVKTKINSHAGNMLILFKDLVCSVLKYDCFCFAEMVEFSVAWLKSQFDIKAFDSHGHG